MRFQQTDGWPNCQVRRVFMDSRSRHRVPVCDGEKNADVPQRTMDSSRDSGSWNRTACFLDRTSGVPFRV